MNSITQAHDLRGNSEQLPESFHNSAHHFCLKTYGSARGALRSQLLFEWVSDAISANPSLTRVVDIGCGDARLTKQLLDRFPHLTAVVSDPSPAMRERAYAVLESELRAQRVQIQGTAIEQIEYGTFNQHSIVLCHGVLGWVENPALSLQKILELPERTKATVSLLVGNRLGHMIAWSVQGELQRIEEARLHQRVASELSSNGLYLFSLRELEDGLKKVSPEIVVALRGLRCISDTIKDETLAEQIDRYLSLERALCTERDYIACANMFHLLLSGKAT